MENDFERKGKRDKDKKKYKFQQLLNGKTDSEKKPTVIDKYNGMETKGDVKNSLVKTLFEIMGGAVVAPVISASLGTFSPIAGILLAFGGNYIGDKTGLIRGIAMGTLAHGVAKSKEYREENTTIKDRMNALKNDWLYILMLKNTSTSQSINGISNSPKESKSDLSENNIENLQSIIQENLSEEKHPPFFFEQEKPDSINKNPEQNDPWDDDDIDFSRF